MTLISLPPSDVPPELNSDDVPPLRCEHDGCTNTLTYSGRGRKPKWCEEHKPSKSVTDSGTSSRGRGSWAKGDAVERNLAKLLNWTAAGITFINAKDGTVIAKGGPAVAHELVELARQDKRLRPYMEWIAAPGKYGPLILALATVAIPIMVNHGLLPQFIIPILEADLGEGVGSNGG